MTRRSDGPKEGGGHEEAAGGVADPAARVAAGAFAQTYAGRAGNHWGDNVVLPNANGPYSGPFDVFALKSGAGSGGADLLKKETKTAAVAASLQSFTYDDDGNMLSDGIWTYSWDGENRLTSLTATSLAVAGGYPNLQLEFKYDYLGRRIEKKVTNLGANGGVQDWRRFLYDGWSLIAEYSVSTSPTFTLTLTRSYTWGLDIARSLKDAGGVGALLQITDVVSTKTYLPTYDGNGNIVSLLNGSSGALAAVYEYSPYGEQFRAETIDSTIANNPFRFSTKYYDPETALYDYGRRYYNPRDGRFLGRDPIEEKGGLHLYAFCGNNGINNFDYLGMDGIDPYLLNDPNLLSQYTFTRDGVLYWNPDYTGLARPVYDKDWTPEARLEYEFAASFAQQTEDGYASAFDFNLGWHEGGGDRFSALLAFADSMSAASEAEYAKDAAAPNSGIDPNAILALSASPNALAANGPVSGAPSNANTTTAVFGGKATVYDAKPGSLTASGVPFNPNAMAAAMPKDLVPKLGTTVTVEYYPPNGGTATVIQVVVNDRGPYAVDSRGRATYPLQPNPTNVIDLTPTAMKTLTGKTYNNVTVVVSIPGPTNQTIYYPRQNGQPQTEPPPGP